MALVTRGALILLLVPALAAAQTTAVPVIEVGGHAGALNSHAHLFTAGPRLTVNVTPDTAVEFAAEFQRHDPDPEQNGYFAAALYHVQLRRQLWRRGNVSVAGLAGAGLGYRDYRFIPQLDRGDVPVPETEFRNAANALLAGLSTEVTVSPRLALRADTQMVFGPVAGLRLVAGATVPLGRRPTWSSPTDGSSTTLARRLPPGQRAWVTTADGREHEGQVRRVDDGTLALALPASDVSLLMADVRRIEIPDSIGNGAAWGGVAGGATMGTLSTIFAVAFCEGGDDCADSATRFVLATAAVGAGLGALGGALIDSFIDGRRLVYAADGGGPALALAPVHVRGGGGVGGRIAWGGR